MNIKDLEAEARAELDAEAHRSAVDHMKVRLRERDARPWWQRLFPYQIKIERLDK